VNADPNWLSSFADPSAPQGDIGGGAVPMTQTTPPPQFQMAPAQPAPFQTPGTFMQPNLNAPPLGPLAKPPAQQPQQAGYGLPGVGGDLWGTQKATPVTPDQQTVPQTAGPSVQTPQTQPGAYRVQGDQGMGPVRMTAEQALPLIQHYEDASGDPTALNYMYDSTHTAQGLYQITNTNWKKYAPQAGIDVAQVSSAGMASPAQQTQVATLMYNKEGFAPWAPYNAALRKAIGWQGGPMVGDPNHPAATNLDAQWANAIEQAKAALLTKAGVDQQALDTLFKAVPAALNEQLAIVNSATADMQRNMRIANDARTQEANLKIMQAKQELSDDEKLTQWANHTPTRQAAMANVMHLTPMLSILAALGGKATRVSALGMLGATAGIVKGVSEGAENQFHDAVDQWQNHYNALKDHMQHMQDTYKTLEEAYAGRADAADKAAEMTMRIEGDQLNADQAKIATAFKMFDATTQISKGMADNALAFQKIVEAYAAKQFVGGVNMADPRIGPIAWAMQAAGVNVPARKLAMVIEGGLMEHPDWKPEQFAEAAASGSQAILFRQWMARTMAKRISNSVLSTWPLIKPGGIYEQLDGAAKQFAAATPGGDTQLEQKVLAAMAGYEEHGAGWLNNTYTSPELQRYVTILEEARAELKQSLSKQGVSTDEQQRRADRELPAWHGYSALHEGIVASIQIQNAVLQGDLEAQDAVLRGENLLKIVRDASQRGFNPDNPSTALGQTAAAIQQSGQQTPTYEQYKPGGGAIFESNADAQAAFDAGRIKKGDKIIVNGQSGTWQ
jgi:hypothetical protein